MKPATQKSRGNLLVADDDLGTRETYDAVLRHAGYDVRLAESGAAAVSALSSGVETHALLLDLKLGDMTGYDVLRWMRGQRMIVPTAVMTAFRAEFDPDEAIALGALSYVDRLLSIDDILILAETLTARPSPRDDPLQLHARYLAGQPGALECLASVFLNTLPSRLQRTFPRVPWDFAVDAVTDACLEYAANPARFDPSRSASIVEFLYLVAQRNLRNRLRAETALKRRELLFGAGQRSVVSPTFEISRSDINLWGAVLAVTLDPKERRAAELWLDGERNDAIAKALGDGHLSPEDRRRAAKRFKDRLLKRLSRYFRPFSRLD